jgi:hypothetical protein
MFKNRSNSAMIPRCLDIDLSRLYNFHSSCRHKVVVVEGNYLLLSEGDWKDLESIFDERWYHSCTELNPSIPGGFGDFKIVPIEVC